MLDTPTKADRRGKLNNRYLAKWETKMAVIATKIRPMYIKTIKERVVINCQFNVKFDHSLL